MTALLTEATWRSARTGELRIAAEAWSIAHFTDGAPVQARLDKAGEAGVREVRLDTSQHSRAFYERLGFGTDGVTTGGCGPGLDRYDMILGL
ncbi:hypothetical protein QE385_002788 [Sphingomonas sp. SORGH_AS 950]|uniref:hypothetical protein n=1 Tax=Sphingomonas sp. SORGH_AS_0950 TaxID=3041792 RepID=UPI002786A022|nr:hypothetical protein [Sphingomonas sp. SORGH_AS_0950]MDQ1158461.1 hypothetical protein [Sphingomonas sp. SORGH_AS_0950]